MTKEEQLKQEAEGYADKKVSKTLLPNLWERYFNSYLAGAEPREKRIEQLEKENKKIFNDWLEACDKYGKVNLEQQKNKEQLEQAKEILVKLLEEEKNNMYWEMNGSDKTSYCEVRKQAEQFLREIDIDSAIQEANKSLDLDKITKEVEDDLKEGCPDVLCEDCKKEDCTVKKLGLVPTKEKEK